MLTSSTVSAIADMGRMENTISAAKNTARHFLSKLLPNCFILLFTSRDFRLIKFFALSGIGCFCCAQNGTRAPLRAGNEYAYEIKAHTYPLVRILHYIAPFQVLQERFSLETPIFYGKIVYVWEIFYYLQVSHLPQCK